MNLNKFTKAELISKIKRTESKIDSNKSSNISIFNQTKTYLSQILDLVLVFKSILIKLTLISFFIQIFNKYRIFGRLWLILNTIVMSMFGISLLENFGFGFLSNFVREVKFILGNSVDYLTNTHFYKYLNDIFSTKEIPSSEKTNKNGISILNENKKETTGIGEGIRENNRNSKISEWLKPDEKKEELVEEIKEVTNKNESNYKKYVVIAGFIVAASLIWVYFPEIKDGLSSALEWFSSNRRRPDSGTSGTGNNQPNIEHGNSASTAATMGHVVAPTAALDSPPTYSHDNKVITIDSSSEELYNQVFSETDKIKQTIDNGKGKTLLTSPSLDELNKKASESWNRVTSPTGSSSPTESSSPTGSDSSTSTIKPSSSSIPSSSLLTDISDQAIFKSVDSNWKNMIEKDMRDNINYVENHIPKNLIEDTKYIENLIEDIKNRNFQLMEEAKYRNKVSGYTTTAMKTTIRVMEKTELWIENMEYRLNNLDDNSN